MLDTIIAATRRRVAERQAIQPHNVMERLAVRSIPPRSLTAALRQPGIQLIAEIKRASPSRGDLCPNLDPSALAVTYAQGGAAALSVLTEPTFFRGSLVDLAEARAGLLAAGLNRPILRKDFIIDVYQIIEARAYGADAILLIAAALAPQELAHLYQQARTYGLCVLIEVHDEAELEQAMCIEPQIIGINSRNLRTMTVSLDVIERLRPLVPTGTLVVAESGIRGIADVQRLRDLNVDGMLVGETLVRAADPEAMVRQLVEAGR